MKRIREDGEARGGLILKVPMGGTVRLSMGGREVGAVRLIGMGGTKARLRFNLVRDIAIESDWMEEQGGSEAGAHEPQRGEVCA